MRHPRSFIVLLLSLATVRCDSSDSETVTNRLVDIGIQTPSYGGVSLDASGLLIVFVLESDSLESAREVVLRISGRNVGKNLAIQLKDNPPEDALLNWRERLSSVLGVNGVVTLGLHRSGRYVEIGVAAAESIINVEEYLRATGFPASAVIIRVNGYPRED